MNQPPDDDKDPQDDEYDLTFWEILFVIGLFLYCTWKFG